MARLHDRSGDDGDEADGEGEGEGEGEEDDVPEGWDFVDLDLHLH